LLVINAADGSAGTAPTTVDPLLLVLWYKRATQEKMIDILRLGTLNH